jgi:hypothetical protein
MQKVGLGGCATPRLDTGDCFVTGLSLLLGEHKMRSRGLTTLKQPQTLQVAMTVLHNQTKRQMGQTASGQSK